MIDIIRKVKNGHLYIDGYMNYLLGPNTTVSL